MLCNANTDRIYKQLHAQYIGNQDSDDYNHDQKRDQKISGLDHQLSSPPISSIQSFRDAYRFVLQHVVVSSTDREVLEQFTSKDMADLMTLTSVYSSKVFEANQARIPSFVLLVLVQERVANIIAHDVAGCESDIIARGPRLAVSFDDLLVTCRTWLIPSAAHEQFCHAAFETILHVGECRLVNSGAEALMSLPPSEVLDILSPFLVAMADSGTMAGWLARTEEMASLRFPRPL
jgi:hypothetical protein